MTLRPVNLGEQGPQLLDEEREARRRHQQGIADRRQEWIAANPLFYDAMGELLLDIVGPGRRVLSVRCQTGEFLEAVKPSHGVGVEISEQMVRVARRLHPRFELVCCDPEKLELGQTFDAVLFDHVFDTVDILAALERVRRHCHARTQLVIINPNDLWQPVLELASVAGLRSDFVEPNWVTEEDLRGFLGLAGFRPIRTHRLVMAPKQVPLLSRLCNDWLAKLPVLRRLCMMDVMVARPAPQATAAEDVTVSVVVPCRNEEGNVRSAVERIPKMGKRTEIVFCDDKSTDRTVEEVKLMQQLHPDKNIKLVAGPGICRAENLWEGFRHATGDVLMTLDADLTVMPEELPMFLKALLSGRGDFVNGSRLVYPIPRAAMKTANHAGNKAFAKMFSFLLDQPIKDSLCGTQVIWKRDWAGYEGLLGTLGIKDLWGTYELLFGATRLHLKIVEVPVHYQERVFGVTKMTRVFANGARMLGICWGAWRRL